MIEDIQKARFLKNLYKLSYAYGKLLDENSLKKAYSEYFRINSPGAPIEINPEILRSQNVANVDDFNSMMLKTIFNMDILYDASHEAVEDMFQTVTSINNRIDNLRSKRATLEKKIDDLIFNITNSDGFYASFTEEFTDITCIDTKLSSVYYDQESRSLSLSSVESGSFNRPGNQGTMAAGVSYTVYENGTSSVKARDIGAHSTNIFDGLNDTNWSYTHRSTQPAIVSMQLDITPMSGDIISKVYGRLSSDKPVKVLAHISGAANQSSEPLVYSGQSEKDFDNFVFNFESTSPSLVSIFLIKNQPDRITTSNSGAFYEYDFIIRDIVFSGPYYETYGSYVSNPISLNSTDNTKNIIDGVSIDVVTQNTIANSIDFFVAKNVDNASSINDYAWIPISAQNTLNKTNPDVVDFQGSNLVYSTIVESSSQSTGSDTLKYFSTQPFTNIPGLEGVSIYKVAKLDPQIQYSEPIILEGYNKFSWYRTSYKQNLSRSLSQWKNEIIPELESNNVIASTEDMSSSPIFWTAPNLNDGGSVLIGFEILVSSDVKIKKTILKNDDNAALWDMSVYVNGVLIRNILPGQYSDEIEFNLKSGKNNIAIAIDAAPRATSGSTGGLYGSLTFLQGSRITDYGMVYQNYLSLINSELFKNNNNTINASFAIKKIDTIDYIISNKKITPGSRMYYYVNNSNNDVSSIRIRADFSRPIGDPKSTPAITSYKVKFKRSDNVKDAARKTATDILRGRSS